MHPTTAAVPSQRCPQLHNHTVKNRSKNPHGSHMSVLGVRRIPGGCWQATPDRPQHSHVLLLLHWPGSMLCMHGDVAALNGLSAIKTITPTINNCKRSPSLLSRERAEDQDRAQLLRACTLSRRVGGHIRVLTCSNLSSVSAPELRA